MLQLTRIWFIFMWLVCAMPAHAEATQRIVDIPTRSGVTQRLLLLTPARPKAVVVLIAGGHGGLQITDEGRFNWGDGNFLVRSRQLFAERGLLVAVLDAPSDRQRAPYLSGFRQTQEHVEDMRAVIAWLRKEASVPVWLVGTSRGTQSTAFAAIGMAEGEGPDGIVLTSTILTDPKGRPVPAMPLERLHMPVLVVHHEQDGCMRCAFGAVPALMGKLGNASRKQLLAVSGGEDRGDPCEAFSHHGFNGLEADVVGRIADWVLAQ